MKKSNECTAQSVLSSHLKSNLKTERIGNYDERQVYAVKQLRIYRKKNVFFLP